MEQRAFEPAARRRRLAIALGAACAALAATTVTPSAIAAGNSQFSAKAVATIRGCSEESIVGFATLKERASDEGIKQVDVYLQVQGLGDPEERGVHIHETAKCEPCGTAGGHFDPGPFGFTSPDGNHPYHLGDLVNLEIRDGIGRLSTRTSRVTLSAGPLSVFDDDGSAIIVHENPDTYCPEGEVAGCAGGGRAACGIIERIEETDDFELHVSTSSKRERPTELDGTTLSDKAYIFLSPIHPKTSIERIVFFVDGRAVETETDPPYDLGGTDKNGKSGKVDTDELRNGTHVASAIITLASGDKTYVSSQFTVDNDKKRFLNGSGHR